MRRRDRQRGYTLLEVVVALAILALSLGALSESFALSLRRSERAENLEQASLLAATIHDRLGIDIPLDGAAHADTVGHCQWQVKSEEVARPRHEAYVYPRGYQARISVDCGQGSAARQAVLDVFALAGAPR